MFVQLLWGLCEQSRFPAHQQGAPCTHRPASDFTLTQEEEEEVHQAPAKSQFDIYQNRKMWNKNVNEVWSQQAVMLNFVVPRWQTLQGGFTPSPSASKL